MRPLYYFQKVFKSNVAKRCSSTPISIHTITKPTLHTTNHPQIIHMQPPIHGTFSNYARLVSQGTGHRLCVRGNASDPWLLHATDTLIHRSSSILCYGCPIHATHATYVIEICTHADTDMWQGPSLKTYGHADFALTHKKFSYLAT